MSEFTNFQEEEKPISKISKKTILLLSIIFVLLCSFLLFNYLKSSSISTEFSYFEVDKGLSVRAIATKAKVEGFVRSELLLYVILTTKFDPTNIHAGTYIFEKNDDVYKVASKLASNEVKDDLVKLTIPEGLRLTEIASIAAQKLEKFDTKEYITEAKLREGFLFPETYFVTPEFTASDLISLQTETFNEKTAVLKDDIINSKFSELEIVTLASIIEREANSPESMAMVSGILQNRLAIDMALQADATMEYVLDKPLSELTASDLDIDSLYNTYLYRGLPPTPIGNPGLQAIKAVLYPTETEYFYYITGNDGEFYYAETLPEHNRNIQNYLR